MTDFDPSPVPDCERERLAHSGLIQPHGALLFIDKASGAFRYVSANARSVLGEDPESLLGRDGRQWLEETLPDPVELPTIAGKRLRLIGVLDLGGGPLDVLVSPNSGGWILEFEPTVADAGDPSVHRLPSVAQPIDAARLRGLGQALVEAVGAVSGFDRVMLYQFHPDWSGEVLAETVRLSQGTYLGLRFPAADIPAIARGLYVQTPYRHIPDAAATPVALLSRIGDGTQLDLTWSDLRSVSPVHAEYLHNMNVRGSFSVSVIVDGQLWGLVACHHPEPKAVSLQRRQHCKDLTGQFAAVLQQFRKSARRGLYEQLTEGLAPVKASADQDTPLPAAIAQAFPALGPLFGVASGVLFVDQEATPFGEPQPPATLKRLHHWCLRNQGEPVWALDFLPEPLREALGAGPSDFNGFLSISLRARRLGERLISLYLLRPEEAAEIAWAGNPEKPLEASRDGLRLSPRNSFERWVEVRHGYARPWDEDTLFAAQQLREQLLAWL